MVINLNFRIVRCRLEGNRLITDDESILIETMGEEEDNKTLSYVGFGGLLILLVGCMAFAVFSIIPDLMKKGGSGHPFVSLFVLVFAFALSAFGLRAVRRMAKYPLRWKVNGFSYLYLEEDDGKEVYYAVKELERKINTSRAR